MTINLPDELERSIRPLILSGRYTSEGELVAEAVRAFLQQQAAEPARAAGMGATGMRDAAEDLDRAIEYVMDARAERSAGGADLGEGPSIVGLFRDDAELIERITRQIMEGRRTRVLRQPADE